MEMEKGLHFCYSVNLLFLHVFCQALALHKSGKKNQSKMFTQKFSQDVSMNKVMQIPDIDKCILFRSVENFSGCQCCVDENKNPSTHPKSLIEYLFGAFRLILGCSGMVNIIYSNIAPFLN